jgi:hypothetical protein
MSNQIKLTIDLSDELVDKVLTIMAISSQQSALRGAMPMLMGMGGGMPTKEPKGKEKPSMGFSMENPNDNKETKEEE